MEKRFDLQFQNFTRIYRSYDKIYHELAVYFHMADSILYILSSLYEMETPCTPKDICDYCSTNKQTVHSALKTLEEQECITISPSPTNKKNRLVELTPKGKELLHTTIQPIKELEVAAFSELSDTEREQLLQLERKYFEAFRRQVEDFYRRNEATRRDS